MQGPTTAAGFQGIAGTSTPLQRPRNIRAMPVFERHLVARKLYRFLILLGAIATSAGVVPGPT